MYRSNETISLFSGVTYYSGNSRTKKRNGHSLWLSLEFVFLSLRLCGPKWFAPLILPRIRSMNVKSLSSFSLRNFKDICLTHLSAQLHFHIQWDLVVMSAMRREVNKGNTLSIQRETLVLYLGKSEHAPHKVFENHLPSLNTYALNCAPSPSRYHTRAT